MNLANKMTVFRIVLIPVMIALYYLLGAWGGLAAAITFAVASFTDLLDGHVARKYHQVSDFGKLFDPLADKMLVTAAMVILLDTAGFEPIWGAVGVSVILLREFAIGLIRQLAAIRGTIVAAAMLGKLKTLCLTFAIIVLFITVPGSELWMQELWYAGHILFGISVLLAVISFISYLVKNAAFLRNASKIREIRQLNAGIATAAHPEPGTVFAVTEQYPQKSAPSQAVKTQTAVPQQQPHYNIYQPQPQQQHTTAPHGNVNLVNTISEGKLTKEIFDSIVLYVIATQMVSLNKIQEKFQIGYRIASDAIDKMEEDNYITKLTPTAKRRILITREQYLEIMSSRQDF